MNEENELENAEKRLEDLIDIPRVSSFLIESAETLPNNPKLPLLLYVGALHLKCSDGESVIKELFTRNQWWQCWTNGIYDYHHYHSTAHEVLAVFQGSATVQFGGDSGMVQDLALGDVVIIPAGVAHKNVGCSRDFTVVGAYPVGQHWDMQYGKPGERAVVEQKIACVPFPRLDPVYGGKGPLFDYWQG